MTENPDPMDSIGSTLVVDRARAIRTLLLSLFVAVAVWPNGAARADVSLLPAEFERTDVLAIELDRRDLFSFDALSGIRSSIRLEIGEEVLFERTRGRVALVLTDRRMLGVASGTGWRELRLGLQEAPATVGLVEDQIALVVTDRRALAFTGSGLWVEEALSPNEAILALRAGASAAVVTTNRRALGIGSDLSRFVSKDLRVREELESVTTQDAIISLRTDLRILVFSAPRASWSVQSRKIN